ncbi:hypothetical protein HYH02_000381 [Chlamydomonas schloesseri]|uniref:Uncharacterized protein n=1 Tax=Chlamydomonas schloesseri TaxID=2026947 RepID=A0A835WW56_9CHLO|nr:hypothetical protein HYH02_000381 [Chlamydomonas schloesseri]|eukprot:KAG2454534.1 hypothetical protein HYH02_000381 [Chlamydomonas schloesseri]
MSLTPELITQFGLLGKVRTGQPLLDALLCLLLPLVLRWAQPRLNRLSLQATATLRQWLTGKAGRKEVVRVIEHVAYEDGYYYDPDGQPANAVLQQALLSYINNCTTSLDAAVASSHSPLAISAPTGPGAARTCARTCARSCTCACACSSPMKALQDMGTAYLSLERRRRRLAAPGDDAASDSDDEGSGERSGSGKSSSGGGGSVSSAGRLREAAAYGLNLAPPVRVWQDLGNGVEFMRYTYVHSSSGSSTYKRRRIGHVVKLRSFGTDGPARVAGLITAALQDHRAQKAARPADRHRYLYVPTCLDPPAISPAPGEPSAGADGRGGGGGGGGGKAAAPQVAAVFKRYRLSSEKTFASLFHPAKDELLRLVAQFEGRQGRFAVPGYPQKLGLLLYGPPGTGARAFEGGDSCARLSAVTWGLGGRPGPRGRYGSVE